jgi:hypothetical protein
MDTAKDAMVSAHTITIMNVGEDEDTGGAVEGEGDEVALVDKKVIPYLTGQKIVERRTALLDHCRRPRP